MRSEERVGIISRSALRALPAPHPLAVPLVAEPVGGRVVQMPALELEDFDAPRPDLDRNSAEDRPQWPLAAFRSLRHLLDRCGRVTDQSPEALEGEAVKPTDDMLALAAFLRGGDWCAADEIRHAVKRLGFRMPTIQWTTARPMCFCVFLDRLRSQSIDLASFPRGGGADVRADLCHSG